MASQVSAPHRIRVERITKTCGPFTALSEASPIIRSGQVLGLLGPSCHPDLFPENNPVLKPPVSGRIGLLSKSDSTSCLKDYVAETR